MNRNTLLLKRFPFVVLFDEESADPPPGEDAILQDNGDFLLTDDGSFLLEG